MLQSSVAALNDNFMHFTTFSSLQLDKGQPECSKCPTKLWTLLKCMIQRCFPKFERKVDENSLLTYGALQHSHSVLNTNILQNLLHKNAMFCYDTMLIHRNWLSSI